MSESTIINLRELGRSLSFAAEINNSRLAHITTMTLKTKMIENKRQKRQDRIQLSGFATTPILLFSDLN